MRNIITFLVALIISGASYLLGNYIFGSFCDKLIIRILSGLCGFVVIGCVYLVVYAIIIISKEFYKDNFKTNKMNRFQKLEELMLSSDGALSRLISENSEKISQNKNDIINLKKDLAIIDIEKVKNDSRAKNLNNNVSRIEIETLFEIKDLRQTVRELEEYIWKLKNPIKYKVGQVIGGYVVKSVEEACIIISTGVVPFRTNVPNTYKIVNDVCKSEHVSETKLDEMVENEKLIKDAKS